jgi:hypothetical protein
MGARRKTENDESDGPLIDPRLVLDAIMDHVAMERAESIEAFTPEEDRWARELREKVESKLAELRRQLTPVQPLHKRLAPIPEELFALDRDALVVRLDTLRQESGIRDAHQDLTGLTPDDLRTMIAGLLNPPIED